jgi:hypothetical protein
MQCQNLLNLGCPGPSGSQKLISPASNVQCLLACSSSSGNPSFDPEKLEVVVILPSVSLHRRKAEREVPCRVAATERVGFARRRGSPALERELADSPGDVDAPAKDAFDGLLRDVFLEVPVPLLDFARDVTVGDSAHATGQLRVAGPVVELCQPEPVRGRRR